MCKNALVCLDCHNKIPQVEWLKQQNALFIFSLFWRLEVHDGGALEVGAWWSSLPDLWTATCSVCTFLVQSLLTRTLLLAD